MKKKPLRKMRLGKWIAHSVNGTIWHVYYDKTHFARIFLNGYRRVEFKKYIPIRKLYYLTRFVNKVIQKVS